MSEQTDAWAGDFGTAYLVRNRVDWRERLPFWDKVMEYTGARSVLELGCNAGWNLTAIGKVAPWASTWGVDVNLYALGEALAAGHRVAQVKDAPGLLAALAAWGIAKCELVFTAGVLIHISDEDLPAAMQAVVDASNTYVLAIEYEAAKNQEIPYRGEPKRLWKRPFGDLYQAMGLSLIERGYLGKRTGFDECTYWLMRKQ